MREYQLTAMETKFADIIWANAPIKSPALVKLCEDGLNWKKSTTYTMLRRLEHKSILKNDKGTVVTLISKPNFYAAQSKNYVNQTFEGSLPRFLTAFISGEKLSDKEINELQKLIDQHRGR